MHRVKRRSKSLEMSHLKFNYQLFKASEVDFKFLKSRLSLKGWYFSIFSFLWLLNSFIFDISIPTKLPLKATSFYQHQILNSASEIENKSPPQKVSFFGKIDTYSYLSTSKHCK